MFTGIISATTKVTSRELVDDGQKLSFARPSGWDDLQLGESVATDGVCLTVANLRDDEYDAILMPETLRITSFGHQVSDTVNLERALRIGDRLSGHFVQGHVDCVGTVVAVETVGEYRLRVRFPGEYQALVIAKGSIALNGVSLTVAALSEDIMEVALVPHTLEHTTLGSLRAGSPVNLEFDMLGKYILNQSHA